MMVVEPTHIFMFNRIKRKIYDFFLSFPLIRCLRLIAYLFYSDTEENQLWFCGSNFKILENIFSIIDICEETDYNKRNDFFFLSNN